MGDLDLDAIKARADEWEQANRSACGPDGPNVHEAMTIVAESAADVPALVAEVERLRVIVLGGAA